MELVGVTESLDTLGHFGHHSCIHFDRNQLFASFEQRGGQITSSRPDFENDVSCFDARLLNNLLDNERVLEDMLTKGLVEREVVALLHTGLAHHAWSLTISAFCHF